MGVACHAFRLRVGGVSAAAIRALQVTAGAAYVARGRHLVDSAAERILEMGEGGLQTGENMLVNARRMKAVYCTVKELDYLCQTQPDILTALKLDMLPVYAMCASCAGSRGTAQKTQDTCRTAYAEKLQTCSIMPTPTTC